MIKRRTNCGEQAEPSEVHEGLRISGPYYVAVNTSIRYTFDRNISSQGEQELWFCHISHLVLAANVPTQRFAYSPQFVHLLIICLSECDLL